MNKTVIARLSVQQEYSSNFIAAAKKMVQDSNNETGCISYRLYRELDSLTDFIFHEEYTNQEAVETHNSSDHFKAFIALITPMLSAEPVIDVF